MMHARLEWVVSGIALASVMIVTGGPGHAAFAGEAVHEIIVRDFEFDPAEITVAPGDTVRWVWESGFHTVTSGINCTFDGLYFNAPISVASPTFEYTIPADIVVDVIDYFCVPHCNMSMDGVVLITGDENPADLNQDDVVNVFDLLILLGEWGACAGCPADLNGDKVVNVFDLLILLGAWG